MGAYSFSPALASSVQYTFILTNRPQTHTRPPSRLAPYPRLSSPRRAQLRSDDFRFSLEPLASLTSLALFLAGLISFWIPGVPDPRSIIDHRPLPCSLASLLPSSAPTQPTPAAAHARCTTVPSNGLTTDHGATSLLHMCPHAARSRSRPLHHKAYASRPPTSPVPLLPCSSQLTSEAADPRCPTQLPPSPPMDIPTAD
jgi:hypothetical protein